MTGLNRVYIYPEIGGIAPNYFLEDFHHIFNTGIQEYMLAPK